MQVSKIMNQSVKNGFTRLPEIEIFHVVTGDNLAETCKAASLNYQQATAKGEEFLTFLKDEIVRFYPDAKTSKELGAVFFSGLKKSGCIPESAKMGETKNKDRRNAEYTEDIHGHLNAVNKFISKCAYWLNEGKSGQAVKGRTATEPKTGTTSAQAVSDYINQAGDLENIEIAAKTLQSVYNNNSGNGEVTEKLASIMAMLASVKELLTVES